MQQRPLTCRTKVAFELILAMVDAKLKSVRADAEGPQMMFVKFDLSAENDGSGVVAQQNFQLEWAKDAPFAAATQNAGNAFKALQSILRIMRVAIVLPGELGPRS